MIARLRFPIMGYNTFTGYGWSITEAEFKEQVILCDKELKPYGYNYMTLDFMWSTPGRDSRDNPDQNALFTPWRNMDMYGRLIPAPDRFPSSIAEMSLKPIADFVHSRNMKFGIHAMCGVPKQAVAAKCVIKGTEITCDKIVSTTEKYCTWNNEMYPIDFSKNGSQEYVNSLIELYTSWEVDLLKIDDLSFPYRKVAMEAYSKAIEASPREIVFSTSPGATPIEEGAHVAKHASMWRISPDFWDTWDAVRDQMDNFEAWQQYKGFGAFPDGDIISVGQHSNFGPWEAPRYSNFTYCEKRTCLAVWSMMNSPIFIGGDISTVDAPTLELLQTQTLYTINKFTTDAVITHTTENVITIEGKIQHQPSLKVLAYVNISEDVVSLPTPKNVVENVFGNVSEFLAPHDTVLYIIGE